MLQAQLASSGGGAGQDQEQAHVVHPGGLSPGQAAGGNQPGQGFGDGQHAVPAARRPG
ncbi:hypothetical protein ACFU7Y_28125 [Kitasatospora sp. NPDC057542]|uniref:hypothetical protein n=1 Tax=Streptomycetaceae TaxID=2062 RepID=UPI001CCA56E8|nr:hypothetical protein [Streptomyces sp. LS1784]